MATETRAEREKSQSITRILIGSIAACAGIGYALCGESAFSQIACRYELKFVEEEFCGSFDTHLIPNGMNDRTPPTLVGRYLACPASPDRGFYWQSDEDNIVPLGLPPDATSVIAFDLSDLYDSNGVGEIVGDAVISETGTRAFVWQDTMWEIIPPLFGGHTSARGISDVTGVVTGTSAGPAWRVYRWQYGKLTGLDLPYGTNHEGNAISPNGTKIAGSMHEGANQSRGFIWDNGKVVDPGWLPGSTLTMLFAVNDFGQAAGVVRVPDASGECPSVSRAAVWRNDNLIDIGVLAPYHHSFAYAINNSGIVVGVSQYETCESGGASAFLRSAELGMVNLYSLIENPQEIYLPPCVAINGKGEITCYSYRLGNDIAVVITPLPRNGDVTCDGLVNVDDLLRIVNSWGPCQGCQADLTEDWTVNVDDLLEVINYWTP